MIRITLSYLEKDGKISLLPDEQQKAAWNEAVKTGLASEDPDVRAEAEALKETLALYEEAEESEHARHYVVVFRDPSWSDKPAIAAEAIRMAEEAGSREAANLYAYPLRVTRLLHHVEALDGSDVDVTIPEALYETLGLKLEPYFSASASLTDFFTPAASRSAGKAKSRKKTSAPAK